MWLRTISAFSSAISVCIVSRRRLRRTSALASASRTRPMSQLAMDAVTTPSNAMPPRRAASYQRHFGPVATATKVTAPYGTSRVRSIVVRVASRRRVTSRAACCRFGLLARLSDLVVEGLGHLGQQVSALLFGG